MLFCVRGTWGGESVCKGTGQTHFVGEPVLGRSAVVGVIDFPPFYWLVGSGVGRAHINPNGPEKLQLDAFNRRP